MHRVFFFLTGENFNTHRRIEPGEVPHFSILEITSLLKACFPGNDITPEYTMHRVMEAQLPAFNVQTTRFLRRSASIKYIGTPDFNLISSEAKIDQAIEEFTNILPRDPDFARLARGLTGKGKTFAVARVVHAIALPDGAELPLKAAIGGAIKSSCGFQVNLGAPDIFVSLFITKTRDPGNPGFAFRVSFNCIEYHTRGFKDRIAKDRPAFGIGTMNPPLTTLMVNCAHPRRDRPALMIDPFCGTGGLLIEALVRGIASIGIDVDYPSIKGCIKNMRHYSKGKKAGFHLLHASTFSLPLREHVEAPRESTVTVTDPPYGRLESLKHARFEEYVGVLECLSRGHGSLCFAMPDAFTPVVHAFLEKDPSTRIVSMQRKREHAGFSRAIFLVSRK
ncbi:MAG: hypothetical protein GYA24_17790 [Candidatus Lokiarchaeota archaeon]|nr:hypothetical protein [Candidatus Lokiarchaeota archaeon]